MSPCPNCQAELPDPRPPFCPRCGKPTGRPAGGTPWERDGDFIETTREVLFGPGAFFEMMPVSGGFARPLVYALIAGSIGALFGAVYGFVLQMVLRGSIGALQPRHMGLGAFQGTMGLVLQVVFAPVGVVIGVFVASAIYHVLLVLFGQAREEFEATFRVVCYAYAASLVAILPFCGSLIGVFWSLALLAIGLSKAHKAGLGITIVVVIAPIILCACCTGAVFAVFARAIMEHMH